MNQKRAGRPTPVKSRTSRALQEMFVAHEPSAWYFGHFHIDRQFLTGEDDVSLLGGDGRIRGRVVRFECRMISCAEPGAAQKVHCSDVAEFGVAVFATEMRYYSAVVVGLDYRGTSSWGWLSPS